jgi:hypothetical protein
MISLELFTVPAVFLVLITSGGLLLSRGWRIALAFLSVQYVGVFLLVAANWPIEQAFVKLITGWIAAAVLGLVYASADTDPTGNRNWPAGRVFRVLVILLIMITVWSIAPTVSGWIPGVSREVLSGGLLLLIMGILQFSLGIDPFYIVIGLLTFLSGFEVIYAAVESSILMTGLMAVTNLILALIGSYLIAGPGLEQET